MDDVAVVKLLEEAARLRLVAAAWLHDSALPSRAGGNGIGNGDDARGDLGMEPLDHFALNRQHAFAFRLGRGEGGDDLPGQRHFIGSGRERLIGNGDLVGMDQRLAIHA